MIKNRQNWNGCYSLEFARQSWTDYCFRFPDWSVMLHLSSSINTFGIHQGYQLAKWPLLDQISRLVDPVFELGQCAVGVELIFLLTKSICFRHERNIIRWIHSNPGTFQYLVFNFLGPNINLSTEGSITSSGSRNDSGRNNCAVWHGRCYHIIPSPVKVE